MMSGFSQQMVIRFASYLWQLTGSAASDYSYDARWQCVFVKLQYITREDHRCLQLLSNTLSISDPDNVTYEEKICILACRTRNPNENSFAAEIVFHADWAINHYHKLGYANAVKADLSAYEDIDIKESFFLEPQYKRRNLIIKNYYNKQIRIHGER